MLEIALRMGLVMRVDTGTVSTTSFCMFTYASLSFSYVNVLSNLLRTLLLSLKLWREHGKLSPKRRKDVSQLVEKYRRQFPTLERPLLRKLIRLENPEVFKNNPSNLKTLDRHLGKAFKNEPAQLKELQKAEGLTREDLALFQFSIFHPERKEIQKRILEKAYGKGKT